MAVRRLFGTDGVRGIAGRRPDRRTLARELGAAAARVGGPRRADRDRPRYARVRAGLEAALVEGIVAAGGVALLAGVIPTPGRGSAGLDAGRRLWAASSRRPTTRIATTASSSSAATAGSCPIEREVAIEAAMGSGDEPGGGRAATVWPAPVASTPTGCATRLRPSLGPLAAAGPRLRQRRCCAGGAGPVFERWAMTADDDRRRARRAQHQRSASGRRTWMRWPAVVRERGADGGIAFDGDADRCLAVDDAATAGERRCDHRRAGDRPPPAWRAARRPGGGYLDDEPRLPPADARATASRSR